MSILKAFTNHLKEFASDIQNVFPEDADLKTGIFFLNNLIKINPKAVINGWNYYVNDHYKDEILKGNIDYFINKDYSEDLKDTSNQSKILSVIDSFRDKVKHMGHDNQEKAVKYLQNLTKLCNMYFSS